MSHFKTISLPKCAHVAWQWLHFTFQNVAMTFTGRRGITDDDDPWRIYAFISAIMEVFLSVLLLLSASITYVASQIVTHFGLKLPPTHIGYSCFESPDAKRGNLNTREDLFLDLCPIRHNLQNHSKRINRKNFVSRNDGKFLYPQSEGYTASDDSSTSSSDFTVPYLYKRTKFYSDSQPWRHSSSSTRRLRCHQKLRNLNDPNSRTPSLASCASKFDESCIPFFHRKPISASNSTCNSEDYHHPTSSHYENCSESDGTTDDDNDNDVVSVHGSEHKYKEQNAFDYQYTLLDDEDGSEEVYNDANSDVRGAVSVSGVREYIAVTSKCKISKPENLSSKRVGPLLGFVSRAGSGERELPLASTATDDSGCKNMGFENGGLPDIGHVRCDFTEGYKGCNFTEQSQEYIRAEAWEEEHHYMLLEGSDAEESEIPSFKDMNLESAQPLLNVPENELKEPVSYSIRSEVRELHVPELSCISQLNELEDHNELLDNHGHHYMLLDGGDNDDDKCETPPFEGLNSDAVQPLLSDASHDNEAEDIGKEIMTPLDSSDVEQTTKGMINYKLPNERMEQIFLEKHEHLYTLLGGSDDLCSEVPSLRGMTSQSLLQGLHEYEPLSQEYTNCKYANLPHANMDNDHLTTDLLELNEDDCHESVEASRKSFYSRKSVKSLQTQNSDASFEDLTSVQLDGQISSPESQKPFNNHERIIKVGIENTNSPTISDAHLPRSDLLPLHCQEDSEQNCNGNCLTDILNNSETLQSSFEMPHVRVTEDVSIFHAPNVELLEPVNSSRQTAAQDMFTGLNFSDPPKTWEQEISLMEGFYQQVVGQPTFSSSNSTHVQDVHSFPMIKRPKVPELSFKKTNINKATISAGFCSVENDVANDILVENIDSLKFTSNALFDKEKKEAELKKSVMNDRPLIIMDDNYSEQVHLGEVESAFDFISEIPEEDTEEAKGGTEYVDSVEELMAEKRMLAVLEAELENERNAAAIATSEAMAMISRLQEEKSMLQLEVAQLQRMAEEKAEYDEQEISLLKDMLFKRETENHALEKELQLYRERLLAEKNPHTWNIYDKPDTRIFVEEQCADQKWEMDYGCQFTKSKERGNHQNIFVKDQVASFIEEGTSVTSSMTQCRERHHSHQGLKEIDRSLFSVNNEELQLILSRIWAIEEELREFQRTSSKKARISLNNDQNLNDNLISQKSADHVFETEVERLPDENDNGNGVCLPVHDVYEVHCTPHQQQGPHIRGDMTTEFLEIPEDSRSFSRSPLYQDTKCALHCQILQADTAAVESLPSSEIQSDGAMNNPQDQPNQYEATEGSALFKDTVQQLAARLQVLEADKQIIREVLESVGNRATELKLLQDISQQLRALWVCGAGSTSSGLRALTSPTSVQQSCAHALKKRRFHNDIVKPSIALIQQRSI